ncbi:hypothetical protein, partial [Streptococcus ovuberis]
GHFSVYLNGPANSKVTVTGISIPQLGIGEKSSEVVGTDKLKSGAITSGKVDEYINTAFPDATTTVTFDRAADVRGATLLNLPNITDQTLTQTQTDNLAKIREDSIAEAGTATGAITGAGAVPGLGWLTDLWEWLKKLLNAILGLPAAILDGLKALWKWLADILNAILAIPGAISKVIVDSITWAFAVDETWLKSRISDLKVDFDGKFPALVPIDFRFTDKASFDDLKVYIPNVGEVVIVQGDMVMRYSPILKNFLRAFFYLITGLFFFRRFYKVAED